MARRKKTINKWRFEIARKILSRLKKQKTLGYSTNKLQSTVMYEMKKSTVEPSNNNVKIKIKMRDQKRSVTLLMEEFKTHLLISNEAKSSTRKNSEKYKSIEFKNISKNNYNNDLKIIFK